MPGTPPEEQLSSAFVDQLSGLIAVQSLDDLLAAVVETAVDTLEGCDGASITLLADDLLETRGASSDAVREADAAQYETEQGPCVEACEAGHEVVAELPSERFPEFSRRALEFGFHKVWALPLFETGRTSGALNLYSRDRSTPGIGSEAARVLTAHTSRLVTNSRSLSVAESQNAHLRRALETRTVIGQAQGILMAQRAIAPDAAFDLLRVASQRTNRKLHDVAMDVVASLGRRGQITVGPEPTADRRAPYLDGV